MFELKGARSARILAGKLLLWRGRLTGAINRSSGYKNIRSGFASMWRKGGHAIKGVPSISEPPPGGSCTCQLYFPMLGSPDASLDRHLCEPAAGLFMRLRFQAAAAASKGPDISSL